MAAPGVGGAAAARSTGRGACSIDADIDFFFFDDPPLNGSWIAELEDAKSELSKALQVLRRCAKGAAEGEEGGDSGVAAASAADTDTDDDDSIVRAYLRLCRAYTALRRWDRVLVMSKRGLEVEAARRRLGGSSTTTAPSWTTRAGTVTSSSSSSELFQTYRKRAKMELAVVSLLDLPEDDECGRFKTQGEKQRFLVLSGFPPAELEFEGDIFHANTSMLQEAAIRGDIRWMEHLAALGAPIDTPFAEPTPSVLLGTAPLMPPGATALVMTCATLAGAESNDSFWVWLRSSGLIQTIERKDLDRIADCAMQLVHLGADPHRTMPENLIPDHNMWTSFKGKTPFQLVAMSKRRRPLAALLWEHMHMSREERVEVIHCRCGSRLPWKKCHSTGVGQPPYYVFDELTQQICYRASPHGRCPCRTDFRPYYKCCWTDNRVPAYVHDKTGELLARRVDITSRLPALAQCLHNLATQEPVAAGAIRLYKLEKRWVRRCGSLFRSHPSLFAALVQDLGPKSRMSKWDPQVYGGCVECLHRGWFLLQPFLWRDVHWDLDRSVLELRAEQWNEALHKYCNEAGLVDDERDRVISLHTANPCGPCGYGGCSAVESTIREFERCAKCKAIAYCSKECQKKDWSEHSKVCQEESQAVLSELIIPV